MKNLVGLLPAAGRGQRLGRYGFAKELFPIVVRPADGAPAEPRPVCDFALERMRIAGVERCLVVIAPGKLEIVRLLEGERLGMSLAYAIQPAPLGLPHAVRLARPWLAGADVALALPDTLIFPATALAAVHAELVSADLVLGVFPVDEPERLGPVDVAPDGEVREVLDKPARRDLMNSWGVACWGPRFTDFCAAWDAEAEARGGGERVLGHAFEAARAHGLRVRAPVVDRDEGGRMLDVGTPRGLDEALAALSRPPG